MKEILNEIKGVAWSLHFTTSKLLAYLMLLIGAAVTILLKSETAWIWSILGSTALFGVKVYSNKLEKNDKE